MSIDTTGRVIAQAPLLPQPKPKGVTVHAGRHTHVQKEGNEHINDNKYVQ